MSIKRTHILVVLLGLSICAILFWARLRRSVVAVTQIVTGKKTVSDRVEQFGDAVRSRLAADFERIGVDYPPERVALVGLKQENLLEVWVSGDGDDFRHLKTYRVLGSSGKLGPKLKEGDMQVPEGLYRIESLNPNSRFHLALRVNYPNKFDKAKGKLDGRENLGCDIMIHGRSSSIGCLAMGDEAAEELFVLAAQTGIDKISVVLSPVDFRAGNLPADMPEVPDWTAELYESIKQELLKLKKTTTSPLKEISEEDFSRLLERIDAMRNWGGRIVLDPIDGQQVRVSVMWRKPHNKVPSVNETYRVKRFPHVQEFLQAREKERAEHAKRVAEAIKAGRPAKGMTVEQLIAVKGKHFKRVYRKQQRVVEVYLYEDETVQVYRGKVEDWWPAKQNAQRLPDLRSTDWHKIPYEDDKEARERKRKP